MGKYWHCDRGRAVEWVREVAVPVPPGARQTTDLGEHHRRARALLVCGWRGRGRWVPDRGLSDRFAGGRGASPRAAPTIVGETKTKPECCGGVSLAADGGPGSSSGARVWDPLMVGHTDVGSNEFARLSELDDIAANDHRLDIRGSGT